jgi:hypothetical protein
MSGSRAASPGSSRPGTTSISIGWSIPGRGRGRSASSISTMAISVMAHRPRSSTATASSTSIGGRAIARDRRRDDGDRVGHGAGRQCRRRRVDQLPQFQAGSDSIWVGFSEISLTDGSTIRTVAPYDWKVEDSNAGPAYDPTLNALISHPQFSSVLTWRYLDRVGPSGTTLGDVVDFVAGLAGSIPMISTPAC